MEKMMSFEEWCKKHDMNQNSALVVAMFHEARVGMIPAENAVVIPDVSEWPRHATGINIFYTWDSFDDAVGNPVIKHIPRPKPVWVPQVGEAVFFRTYNSGKAVGEFRGEHETFDTCWKVMNTDGNMVLPAKCDCKPFHESHIGKPWDAIPGEPS